METIIQGHLEGIKFGALQIHGHVAVIPIISTNGSGPDYLTMKEVLGGASSNGYGSYRRRNGTGIEGHQLGG